MAEKLTKAKLKKHLGHLEQKELIEEIAKLFAKFKEVKQYYQMEYGSVADRNKIVEDYKKKIRNEFYTRSGIPKYSSLSNLKKLLSNFSKSSPFKYDVIDVMLYRVEQAVEFTNDFGDIDERFYVSTEGVYANALHLITSEKLQKEFDVRAYDIVYNTRNIGWGFHDTLMEIYEEVYGEFII